MRKRFIVLAVALFASSNAFAVSLINKDSKSYDIKVIGSSTMSTSIQSGTVKNGICNSSCKIVVDGVGDIEASGSDKVVIKDGKLSIK